MLFRIYLRRSNVDHATCMGMVIDWRVNSFESVIKMKFKGRVIEQTVMLLLLASLHHSVVGCFSVSKLRLFLCSVWLFGSNCVRQFSLHIFVFQMVWDYLSSAILLKPNVGDGNLRPVSQKG